MHGLYLLWWVGECDLRPAVVAAVLAAGDLAVMLLEVPTGWLADRLGHRLSLILGSFTQVLGMLWCWLGEGVPGLVVATGLVALGDAFRSGADEALLYRSCAALGREGAFQRLEARTRAVERAVLAALVVAGGAVVATWGFAVGWLAEAALCAIGLALACAMVEPSVAAAPETRSAARSATLLPTRLIAWILPAAVLGAAASATSFLVQTSEGYTALSVTWVVALMTLSEASGAALASRLRGAGSHAQQALAILGVALATLGLILPATLLYVAVALRLASGLCGPLRAGALQGLATDGTRAQAASWASACDMALSTLTLPLAGLWRGRRS